MPSKCIECRSEIDEDANICKFCQSYQKPIKNWLRFSALLAGGVALVGSAGAYLVGKGLEFERYWNWQDDVEVVEFVRSGESSFLNAGDGEVYLSYVHLSAEGLQWEETQSLNSPVSPGGFSVVPSTVSDVVDKHHYRVGFDIPERAFNRYLHADSLRGGCILFDVYYEEGGAFQKLRERYGNALNTFGVSGEITYRSLHQGTVQTHPLDLIGVLNLSGHDDCREALNNLRSDQ
ncbi:hypothetical protein RSO41_14650 [Halomonas sp. I1]|uniref:hypothetical protein n=1 Tax=Halomonas sp. I1 TaxID=393536 RepID=UPI0028DEC8DD|nr:hypothetical protein [Halomonas sp. I1]MDT8895893.1 hypothetical protein [Halomonas sp. I1]